MPGAPTTHPLAVFAGSKSAAISNLTVRLLSQYTGRGPTKARTYVHEDVITVVLRDTLTKAEVTLVDNDHGATVLATRHTFQEVMGAELVGGVEEITGRTVLAFLSANHIAPDIAVETFILAAADPAGLSSSAGDTPPGLSAIDGPDRTYSRAAARDVAAREAGAAARRREDSRLFARRDAGDAGARDALAERFLPLAHSLARRYERSNEPLDDLVQVASLALVKAIDRFDASQGSAFSSFAVPTIVGELKRYFRDRTWTVRPPRALQELTLRVERAVSELSATLDRSPTVSELAAELRSSEEQILEALQARGRAGVSLQAPRSSEDDQQTLQDSLGGCDDGFRLAESRVLLDDLTAGLSPRSREVLRLRFEQDLTQAEIGELLGVSQMQVSRIIHQALAQMRLSAAA